jgi:uncharacterized protein with GYD domain
MATFITTLHFTEQGVKAVGDTCERAAAFKAMAKKMGVKVTGQYWTLGAFDGVIVLEAPDEATATAALLHLGTLGNNLPAAEVNWGRAGTSTSGRPAWASASASSPSTATATLRRITSCACAGPSARPLTKPATSSAWRTAPPTYA